MDKPEAPLTSRLMVLMFTDLVNSTGLKNAIGAAAYRPLIARHDAIMHAILSTTPGARMLQDTGDGYFVAFETVSDAVRAALRFQAAMSAERWPHPFAARVGVHMGEVALVESEVTGQPKLFASAVDLASRVMSLATGGQILLTRVVFDEARQYVKEFPAAEAGIVRPALRWVAHGPYLFKGAADPVDVFEVGGEGMAPLAPPPDSDKARRHLRAGEEATLGWRPAVDLPLPNAPGWVIERKLGAGGFGEVWLARHAKGKVRRVFKFCFDADRLRALKREVVLFRLLKESLGERRDIARVIDWQFDAAPYFIETDYAPLGNLIDWAESRGGIDKVPLAERLRVVGRVAEALAAAHSIGVLHKDIKPSNVLMAADGGGGADYPRLADFGIGALADRSVLGAMNITSAGFTASNVGLDEYSGSGTRLYAPPETLAGKPYTMQGDLYALGVMLYQMAVGDLARPLAEGWRDEVDNELLREEIGRCVDGNPERRFASAAEVAERLATLDQRTAARERERRAARRKRLTRVASVAGLAIAVVAATVITLAVRQRNARRDAAALAVSLEEQRARRLGLDYSPPVDRAAVAAFEPGLHPAFGPPPAAGGVRTDPTVIKFDHARHMPRLAGKGGTLNDRCATCHNFGQPAVAATTRPADADADDAAGAALGGALAPVMQTYTTDHRYMQSVNYDRHCTGCHRVAIQPPGLKRGKSIYLPHARGQIVLGVLAASMRRAGLLDNAKSGVMNRAILEAGATCVVCHEPTPDNAQATGAGTAGVSHDNLASWRGNQFELVESGIPRFSARRWYTRAEFNHEAHGAQSCLDCHPNAAQSARASDVLLPQIGACVTCHNGNASGGSAPADCRTCHRVK
jgi:class 3 adenylate cyclase